MMTARLRTAQRSEAHREYVYPVGTEAVVVDPDSLRADHILIEVARPAPHLVGGKAFEVLVVSLSDLDLEHNFALADQALEALKHRAEEKTTMADTNDASTPNVLATGGLWRKSGLKGGKFLVLRRDGTVPEYPYFVLGARDPAAAHALSAYADFCEQAFDCDPQYAEDVRALAKEFQAYCREHGASRPDQRPHRTDDPETVAKMVSTDRSA